MPNDSENRQPEIVQKSGGLCQTCVKECSEDCGWYIELCSEYEEKC